MGDDQAVFLARLRPASVCSRSAVLTVFLVSSATTAGSHGFNAVPF